MKMDVIKVACATCNLREICLPIGLTQPDLEYVGQMVELRRFVERGEALFRLGDEFKSLFVVWTGFFKTRVLTEGGHDQVTGFQMSGELLGLDGISSDRHTCDAVALEDSQACQIPYERLEGIAREVPGLQRQLHKLMSREIVRDHGAMLSLGSLLAEARLAAFLLDLAHRLQARGFSSSSLHLRMSREEIGSYLGITVETVSRTFTHFQQAGLLEVRQRNIHILDEPGLHRLLE